MEAGFKSLLSEEFLAYWADVFIRYRLLNNSITFDEFVRDPHRALRRINRHDVIAQLRMQTLDEPEPRPRVARHRLRGWLASMRAIRSP